MYLYSNIKYLTNEKVTMYEIAKLANIPQQTFNGNIRDNREFKGNQIYAIFNALKSKKLVKSLDQLFLEDLSKEWE